jgi:hypothetical protein
LAAHHRARHRPPAVAAVEPVEPPATVVRDVPAPPEGLVGAGLRLWTAIVDVYDLRPDELRILEDAGREAMLIDRMDRELESAPLVVKGSMGQPTASPMVQEIRQHRATFAQLMGKLRLPDDPEVVPKSGPAERAVKARAAANARWRRGSAS